MNPSKEANGVIASQAGRRSAAPSSGDVIIQRISGLCQSAD